MTHIGSHRHKKNRCISSQLDVIRLFKVAVHDDSYSSNDDDDDDAPLIFTHT
jgi:hypothetical protein